MPVTSIKGREMPPSPIRKLVPFAEQAKKEGKKTILKFIVEDTGIGIPKDKKEDIFI